MLMTSNINISYLPTFLGRGQKGLNMQKVLLLLCLGTVVVFVNCSVAPLDKRLIHLIDYTPYHDLSQKFLFRGNQPQDENGRFAYEELKGYLREVARQEGGLELPEDFIIQDISFLQPNLDGEGAALGTESLFFQQHPSRGSLLWWQLIGDTVNASMLPIEEVEALAKALPFWQADQLPQKMLLLRQLLWQPAAKTTVLYVHCGHGQDRTGEMSASYLMQYKGQSWEQVYTFNTKMGMDQVPNILAMQWYCYYLKYSMAYSLDCTLPLK